MSSLMTMTIGKYPSTPYRPGSRALGAYSPPAERAAGESGLRGGWSPEAGRAASHNSAPRGRGLATARAGWRSAGLAHPPPGPFPLLPSLPSPALPSLPSHPCLSSPPTPAGSGRPWQQLQTFLSSVIPCTALVEGPPGNGSFFSKVSAPYLDQLYLCSFQSCAPQETLGFGLQLLCSCDSLSPLARIGAERSWLSAVQSAAPGHGTKYRAASALHGRAC
jgi:hypothetical protein